MVQQQKPRPWSVFYTITESRSVFISSMHCNNTFFWVHLNSRLFTRITRTHDEANKFNLCRGLEEVASSLAVQIPLSGIFVLNKVLNRIVVAVVVRCCCYLVRWRLLLFHLFFISSAWFEAKGGRPAGTNAKARKGREGNGGQLLFQPKQP